MLTAKGKYGLKAMLHLAGLVPEAFALSNDIAEANRISKKFLDAILADLRQAGFVHARKGRGGGYRLRLPASEVRVGHVLRVLDGPLAPIHCASRTAYSRCDDCADEANCAIRLVMLDVRNAITAVLDDLSLAEMRERGAQPGAVEAVVTAALRT